MIKVGLLPFGGERFLKQRLNGRNPKDMVIVSFIGFIPDEFMDNTTRFTADPRKQYDWRFLAGLEVCMLVQPGANGISKAMYDLAFQCRPGRQYAWDVQRGMGADLYMLPDPNTVGPDRDKWVWKLEALPWLSWQNREFIS